VQVALKTASTQIQIHVDCDNRGSFIAGQIKRIRLSNCNVLLETACQKLESLVVPVTESPRLQAREAGMIEESMMVGTMKASADRVFPPDAYA
jgi:hypothetical protein